MTAYVTTVEIMDAMPDVEWKGSYEAFLSSLATRASRLIDRATGRAEGAFAADTDAVRYFDGSGHRTQWVDEIAAAPTAVAVDEAGNLTYTAWTTSDYMLWPYNAADEGRPYRRLDIDQMNGNKALWYAFPKGVKITAKWGYSTTPPDDIKQAVIIQAVRWFKRAQQAYQDVGAIIELGQLRYVKQLDPDVAFIVEHYRRVTI